MSPIWISARKLPVYLIFFITFKLNTDIPVSCRTQLLLYMRIIIHIRKLKANFFRCLNDTILRCMENVEIRIFQLFLNLTVVAGEYQIHSFGRFTLEKDPPILLQSCKWWRPQSRSDHGTERRIITLVSNRNLDYQQVITDFTKLSRLSFVRYTLQL
jgi:hypothetical protein